MALTDPAESLLVEVAQSRYGGVRFGASRITAEEFSKLQTEIKQYGLSIVCHGCDCFDVMKPIKGSNAAWDEFVSSHRLMEAAHG
jgi:hypothetical protein